MSFFYKDYIQISSNTNTHIKITLSHLFNHFKINIQMTQIAYAHYNVICIDLVAREVRQINRVFSCLVSMSGFSYLPIGSNVIKHIPSLWGYCNNIKLNQMQALAPNRPFYMDCYL